MHATMPSWLGHAVCGVLPGLAPSRVCPTPASCLLPQALDALVRGKVKDPDDFEWQRQVRFYWHDTKQTVQVSICDVDFEYSYEYLGEPLRQGERGRPGAHWNGQACARMDEAYSPTGCCPASPAWPGATPFPEPGLWWNPRQA